MIQLTFQTNDTLITLETEPEGDGYRVRLPDGTEHLFTARRLPDGTLLLTMADRTRSLRVPVEQTERGGEVAWDGQTYLFTPATERQARRRQSASSGLLTAPMVGVVAEVMVSEGQTVEAYKPLAVVEAMKVMATVEAPFAGVVKSVSVHKGDRVAHGAALLEIAPLEMG